MKKMWSMLAVLALLFVFTVATQAEDKEKKVTLKGSITCAKCDLKKETKCATVITVKEGEKTTVYYFDDVSGKKHHAKICTEAKPGTVKGTVEKKGDKMIITATDVQFD